MTKFEEELFNKVPCKFELTTEAEYKKSTLINHFKNWHSDEEFQELSEKLDDTNDALVIAQNSRDEFEREYKKLKYQLQQQALPVVPECAAEFIESYKDRRTIYGVFDKISKNRKTYPKLYEWVFEDENSQATFALAFITGKYTIEKPQLFYLKNKLTTSYLALDINTGYYEHWGEEIIPKLLNKQGYKLSFTQQEIDSMEARSYEQIEVTE